MSERQHNRTWRCLLGHDWRITFAERPKNDTMECRRCGTTHYRGNRYVRFPDGDRRAPGQARPVSRWANPTELVSNVLILVGLLTVLGGALLLALMSLGVVG